MGALMLVEFVLSVGTGPWLVGRYAVKHESPNESHTGLFVVALVAGIALWALLAATGVLDSVNLGIVHALGLQAPGYQD